MKTRLQIVFLKTDFINPALREDIISLKSSKNTLLKSISLLYFHFLWLFPKKLKSYEASIFIRKKNGKLRNLAKTRKNYKLSTDSGHKNEKLLDILANLHWTEPVLFTKNI